jgi:hypothetical protein
MRGDTIASVSLATVTWTYGGYWNRGFLGAKS